MSWLAIVGTYGLAYLFLSVCTALVVGRLVHMAAEADVGGLTRVDMTNGWSDRREAGGSVV